MFFDVLLKRCKAAKTVAAFFQQKRRNQTTHPSIAVGKGMDFLEDELGKGGNHSLVIIPPIKIFNIFVHKYGHFLGGGGEVDDSPRLAEDCPGLTTPITR